MKRILLLSTLSVITIGTYAQNVGIGTANPTERLQVQGNIKVSDTIKVKRVAIGTDTAYYPVTLQGNGMGIAQRSDNGAVAVGTYTSNSEAYIQTHTNHPLNFATNNQTSQMVLTTAGNLSINSSTSNQKLNVGGAIKIGSTTAPEQGTLRYNNSDSSYEAYNKNSWQSLVNDFSIVGQSNNGDLTYFSSLIRNQYVAIPALSYTVKKSGYYLIILTSDGSSGIQEKNNIYNLNDNRTDFAGTVRLTPQGNPVSRYLVKNIFSSHIDNNGDPTQDQTTMYTSIDGDMSNIRYLNLGEVIQGYAYIEQNTGSASGIPAQQNSWYTHIAAKFILLK